MWHNLITNNMMLCCILKSDILGKGDYILVHDEKGAWNRKVGNRSSRAWEQFWLHAV